MPDTPSSIDSIDAVESGKIKEWMRESWGEGVAHTKTRRWGIGMPMMNAVRTNGLLVLAMTMLIVGCDGGPPPGCRCEGPVPGGMLNVACDGTQCLGGIGYRCTGMNTAEEDPTACGSPDGGPGGCGPGTCAGCCVGGVCQAGTTNAACGAGGLACGSCGGGTACVGGLCQATGCSHSAVGLDTCVGDDICICPGSPPSAFCDDTGACSTAFGRRYQIFVASVMLPDRRPDGMCWDGPGCGAPDPFVEVLVNGILIGTSPAASNTFNATLNYGVDANITAGSSIALNFYDQDIAAHDGAIGCVFDSVTAALLRNRNLGCSGMFGDVVAVIIPL